jgi:catechol 2,3-dioxygenase-like lactoylglutathione lyase family enzyme
MLEGIRRLDHVGICVPDLDAAKNFYSGILGMAILRSRPWAHDSRMDQILGLTGSSGERALLEGLNTRIELWWFGSDPTAAQNVAREVNTPGITHLCFEVEDLIDLHRRLTAANVRFVSEPSRGPTGSVAVYARDPFGNFLEFFQPAPPRP